MSDTEVSEVASLLIPVSGKRLLLPNVAVAEIIDYATPDQEDQSSADDGFLGFVRWRGTRLPVVSYERANGDPLSPPPANARLAVINTIGVHAGRLPFFAMVTQGIPRLMKVQSDIIVEQDSHTGPADKMRVRVGSEETTIPDVEYLEELVVRKLNH